MNILDGKDHRRGRYEKAAPTQVLDLLLGSAYWGWLAHPSIAERYSPEGIASANATFLTSLRQLVDQWIDSGISADGAEAPASRQVRVVPDGCSQSLFDLLREWLGRFPPKSALNGDGTTAVLVSPPTLEGGDLDAYAGDCAV